MTRSKVFAVVTCGALIVTLGMGIRQSFGLFLQPISADLEIGRQVFGLAIAIQTLLFGLVQPFTGAIADRFGAGRVVVAGALLYAAGLVLAGSSQSPAGLYLTLGVVIGLAMSGTTFVVALGAVGRVVAPQHRSLAFGLVTAGGSFGQFAVVPGAQALLSSMPWQSAFVVLAVLAATMAVLALGVAGKAETPGAAQSLRGALAQAGTHSGYWLLNAGFFVCGFHVSFISTHLPAYLADRMLPPETGAWSLALIGLFNIFGSYVFGVWGDRRRKKYLLGWIYLLRAVAIAAFVVVPVTSASALAFSATIGFLWLGTVPLTSGIVAQVFGTRYLSTLFGIVFLFHQLGGFLGAWFGGYAFDLLGSYDAVWTLSIVLAVVAALVHLPIADAPLAPRAAPLAAR